MRVRPKRICGIPGTEHMHETPDGIKMNTNLVPARPVECIETGMRFESIGAAARYYNINYHSLKHTLEKIKTGHKESGFGATRRTAGFDPKTGKSLHWRYV